MPLAARPRATAQFWAAPHRPLFLSAFVWALISVAWWPLAAEFGVPPPYEPAVLWHFHELLFGFVSAAMGGYLLTALPGWTRGSPLRGAWLQGLALLWWLGRLTTGFAFDLPLPVLLLGNSGYALLMAAILFWQIVRAQALPKLGFVAAVLGLGLGDAVFTAAMVFGQVSVCLFVAHMAIIATALLIVVIAGRAIPAFTRNWLRQSGKAHLVVTDGSTARFLSLALIGLAMSAEFAGWPMVRDAGFVAAALMLLWVMRGWQSLAALRNPLLVALHLAFP